MDANFLRVTLIFLLTLGLFGCQKDEIIHNCKPQKGYVCVYYDVQKCEASPKKTDDEILQNKIDELDQKGIELKGAYIDDKGKFEGCEACFCKSGKRIYGKVKETDLEQITGEGFAEL